MLAILWGNQHTKQNEIAVLKARITALEIENASMKSRLEEL
jgi:hypothetical protein